MQVANGRDWRGVERKSLRCCDLSPRAPDAGFLTPTRPTSHHSRQSLCRHHRLRNPCYSLLFLQRLERCGAGLPLLPVKVALQANAPLAHQPLTIVPPLTRSTYRRCRTTLRLRRCVMRSQPGWAQFIGYPRQLGRPSWR